MKRYVVVALLCLLLVLGFVVIAYTQESAVSLLLNGKTVETDVAPFIKDGRTFIPVAAVVKALGGEAEWDAVTRTASLTVGTVEPVGNAELASINGKISGLEASLVNLNQTLMAMVFDFNWRTQRTYKFPVDTKVPVNDLHIEFTGNVAVGTDDDGKAGPFQDIDGNGTGRIDLSNPEENDGDDGDSDSTLEPGDTARLVFRSAAGSISIKRWYWTKDGKQVPGNDHSGPPK
ncbi:MAG: copper amine oxidase N-terminal domain-containing protein [Bacillota bacterium]